MLSQFQLISFHVIHTFHNNNSLITWSYPSLSVDNKQTILANLSLLKSSSNKEIYLKCSNWLYLYEIPSNREEYKSVVIVLITKDFNPCKYSNVGKLFCKKYLRNNSSVELVKIYLELFTKGDYKSEKNGFEINKFSLKTNLKDLIKLFGLEIILIYTALLLKKRIIVYHSEIVYLQKCLLSFSYFVDNRNPNLYLLPIITHVNEIKNKQFFMAGIKDNIITIKPNNYDLFVNLNTNTINISTASKETFLMTKTHKDIAIMLQQLAEDVNISEENLISQLNEKSRELLTFLTSLATTKTDSKKEMITIENLRSKGFNKNLENFLFNIAIAENIMMV